MRHTTHTQREIEHAKTVFCVLWLSLFSIQKELLDQSEGGVLSRNKLFIIISLVILVSLEKWGYNLRLYNIHNRHRIL